MRECPGAGEQESDLARESGRHFDGLVLRDLQHDDRRAGGGLHQRVGAAEEFADGFDEFHVHVVFAHLCLNAARRHEENHATRGGFDRGERE